MMNSIGKLLPISFDRFSAARPLFHKVKT